MKQNGAGATAPYFVCLDVGGTQLKGGLLGLDGCLVGPLRRADANAESDADSILNNLAALVAATAASLPPQGVLAGVRVAFPGPFDYPAGVCQIQGLAKYGALYGVNLRQALAGRLAKQPGFGVLGADAFVFLNDVAAFALGELRFGVAKGRARAMFVCIGTGCGSAFGLDGRLAPAGTPGVPPHGYIYPTPFKNQCIDDVLSRRGLVALSRQHLGRPLEGKPLAELAKAGDAGALRVWGDFGALLAEGLTPFLAGYHPEILCLGGQVTASGGLFLEPLRAACRALGVELALTQETSLRAMQGVLPL
ncbi:MAG: ROK family protein [Gemmiger sp.]|nr:ROK family protein [Gemmiger sp.]